MVGQRGIGGSVLLLVVLIWGGGEGRALAQQQSLPSSPPSSEPRFCADAASAHRSLDVRGLALVYCTTTPGLIAPLRGAHATARPVFYSAVPAAWVRAGITQDQSSVAAAYRLTLTQGLTLGLVVGTKHAVGRSRPYVDHPLAARADRHTPPAPGEAHLSFPSGHTGLSAALVTSWSLSYPRWYVIGPGALWATGVALSRVYLGVHYPSDVLAGAVLGIGLALLVHQLRGFVTPPSLRASSGAQQVRAAPLVLRIQF